MKPGKTVFARFDLDLDLQYQISRMSFHSFFKALKQQHQMADIIVWN